MSIRKNKALTVSFGFETDIFLPVGMLVQRINCGERLWAKTALKAILRCSLFPLLFLLLGKIQLLVGVEEPLFFNL